ncbi:putative maleylacetate reductase [Tricladium varicosporioides]|nr:putative maleylacetate reductase [Hymenoscyphus varicosporioides]
MDPFEYNSTPSRVIFGNGTLSKLPEELSQQELDMPLLVCGAHGLGRAIQLQKLLDGKVAGTFSEATMHTPVHITEKALAYVKSVGPDSIVSIGGGSSIGLGKAISINTGLPHICIPTTYAGSEMTPVVGETKNGKKTTRHDPKILPNTVIYDVDLTMTLPASMSATSGINAMAHAVEALYARNSNPIVALLALEGIKALALALPQVVENPSSSSGRQTALYGAWLCGKVLGSVGMALHHKLCHILGGSFNMPHAETHTILLPHVLAYNAPAVPLGVMKKLAEVIPNSDGDAIKGLNLLLDKLGVKRSLKFYGFREEDVDKATDIVTSNVYWNPRPIVKEPIKELLRRAWKGEQAKADL